MVLYVSIAEINASRQHTVKEQPTVLDTIVIDVDAYKQGKEAVARELSSGWGDAQLTFANVVHDRKKPRVPPNIVFSSVLGHLFLALWPFHQ